METLVIAKQKISEGAKFNGVVYGKNNGKNFTFLFIYLDGEFFKLGSVWQKEASAMKKEYEDALNATEPVKIEVFEKVESVSAKSEISNTVTVFAQTYCNTERAKALADFHSFCEGED